MAKWDGYVLTQKGKALNAKLIDGNNLTIVKAVAGSGYVDPSTLKYLTALTEEKQEISFSTQVFPEEGECAIPVKLSNTGIRTGYKATQIGIIAFDPDEGEILYLVSQATDGDGTDVPPESKNPGFSTAWKFYIKYTQAENVSVTVNPSNTINAEEAQAMIEGHNKETAPHAGVLAKQADLTNHTSNTSNPHNVTADQIGLGNVDNTPDSQKNVAFASEAGTARKIKYDMIIRLKGGRTEGTDLFTYDGSTSKSVNITPANIGAAAADHTHSAEDIGAAKEEHDHDAADINIGTLDLARLPLDELINLYIWTKFDSEPKNIETEQSNVWIGKGTGTGKVYQSVRYADAITNKNGALSLVNPTTIEAPTSDSIQVVKGKYIYSAYADKYFRIPSDASITDNQVSYPSTYYTLQVSSAYELTPSGSKLGYVASKEASTYPTNGNHTDGYWYVYHKQLGE